MNIVVTNRRKQFFIVIATLIFNCGAQADEVDVYLLAGQSNMQGVGRIDNLPASWQQPMLGSFFWNGKSYEPLNPLTSKISARKNEFGPELGFVRGIRRNQQQQPIYIVKFYRSGQPLHHGWNGSKWAGPEPGAGRANFYPGAAHDDPNIGKHYADWLRQCKSALDALKTEGHTPIVRGVVWMQGEQDSKHEVSAHQYHSSLSHLRARLSADLEIDTVPWVFGQVLPYEPALERFTNRSDIREKMSALDERSGRPESVSGFRMVSTDGFELKADTVHYDADGQRRLGLAFAQTIIDMQQGDAGFDLRKTLEEASIAATEKNFHGFNQLDFKLGDVGCMIVEPTDPAPGKPWIWRARFWGHQPQFDIAMLKKGWHVCYSDVGNLFGSDDAIKRWDDFYSLSQKFGLHPQPFLEGMSRGGLIIMRWASEHPDQVSGIYADNAVMDFTSWPGGLGTGKGGGAAWQDCLKAYGLTEQGAKDFRDGPLDRLEPLAQSKIPISALINEADDVVPPAENSDVLVKRYRELGGPIKEMRRPGLGHHPHSLKDPAPLVEFAIEARKKTGL